MYFIGVLGAVLFASSAYAKFPFEDDHKYTVICSDHIRIRNVSGKHLVPSDNRLVINDEDGNPKVVCFMSNITVVREER